MLTYITSSQRFFQWRAVDLITMGLASLDVQCFIVLDFRSAHPWNVSCIGRGALPKRYYELISIQLLVRREFVEAFFCVRLPAAPHESLP